MSRRDLYPGQGAVGKHQRFQSGDGSNITSDNPVGHFAKRVMEQVEKIGLPTDMELILIAFRPTPGRRGLFDQTITTSCSNPEILTGRLSQALERLLDPETFRDVMKAFAKWEEGQRGG